MFETLFKDMGRAVKRLCPSCYQTKAFTRPYDFIPCERCAHCDQELDVLDVGDGAIVFLIFLLGATIVPAAIIWEFQSSPPIWLQLIIWCLIGFAAVSYTHLTLPTIYSV